MHQMFLEQEQANTAISYKTYWSVFHYHYNLGFGTPATDVCSTCVSHKLKIKNLMLTEQQRQMVATEFLVHKRKARMFYDRLSKTVPDSLTICFDVMENLVLPRTQIGQAYFWRQLYLHVFCHRCSQWQRVSLELQQRPLLCLAWRPGFQRQQYNIFSCQPCSSITTCWETRSSQYPQGL